MNSKMTMNQTIADKIYNKLKEDMSITGNIKLGQRMDIKKISKDFRISQIPIREALNRLVKDNLIVYKPRRGYYVGTLSYKDMEEIYKLREYIENKNIFNQRKLNFQFHQLII